MKKLRYAADGCRDSYSHVSGDRRMFSYLRWAPSRAAVTVGGPENLQASSTRMRWKRRLAPAVMKKLVYTDLVRQAATAAKRHARPNR